MIADRRVIRVMNDLRIKHHELVKYGGFGYCGYGSQLLRDALLEKDINSVLLVSKYFANTVDGNKAKFTLSTMVMDIADTDLDSNYREIKRNFIKRGKLPDNLGHAVLLIGEVIYDITSEQFGLHGVYSLSLFRNIWKEIYLAKIKIDSTSDFGIKEIKLGKRVCYLDKPIYANW